MKSIFHIEADTAEELRAELIVFLENEAEAYHRLAATAKLQRDISAALAKREAVLKVLSFWNNLVIDRKAKL